MAGSRANSLWICYLRTNVFPAINVRYNGMLLVLDYIRKIIRKISERVRKISERGIQ